MPISTPAELVKEYGNDSDHFKHALECLIAPAVKSAGYEPIPPTAAGSEVIQASIIKNLSQADMVLCDLSTLNPNVFYELGIRTSLNKPVAIIHDEHVKRIPFDTGIINAVRYESTIHAWHLDRDKLSIIDHIKQTATLSKGKNPMWQYFGIPQTAALPTGQASTEQLLEIMLSKFQGLEKKVDSLREPRRPTGDYWFSDVVKSPVEQHSSITDPLSTLGGIGPSYEDVTADHFARLRSILKAAAEEKKKSEK